MSKIIENPKSYTGRELETIFFRPMLSGPSAIDLGVRIMYNMPVPTMLNFWHREGDVLQKYAKGWNGGELAKRFQKEIRLSKVKAEMGYSASDYFGMIYEMITNSGAVNLDDLSGTELEQAETTLFRQAIAESIRATMWLGDTERASGSYTSFNGFLKAIKADLQTTANTGKSFIRNVKIPAMSGADAAISLFERMWNAADDRLTAMKDEGNLVIQCTSDIYLNYEKSLEDKPLESAFAALQQGRKGLHWHGIPIVDVKVGSYLSSFADMPLALAILTDKRNMALAVNTADFPGNEVRMWYNPDEMENRQRAIFMAGADYLLPELLTVAVEADV